MWDYITDEHHKPFPELLAGVAYQIYDSRGTPGLPSTGVTNKAEREMWVPFELSGRTISQHENGHVLWSPTSVPVKKLGAPLTVVQAVEDGRINLGLAHLGLALVFDDSIRDEVVRIATLDINRAQFGALTLRLVASFGTNLAPALLDLVTAGEPAALRTVGGLTAKTRARFLRARWRTGGPVATFMQGLRIARWLMRQLDKHGFEAPKQGILVGCGGGVCGEVVRSQVGLHFDDPADPFDTILYADQVSAQQFLGDQNGAAVVEAARQLAQRRCGKGIGVSAHGAGSLAPAGASGRPCADVV